MDLSSIKTVQITEKNLNPNGILLFDNYVKKMVSNYVVSWISNSDQTLSMFYQGNPPVEVGDINSVYRGYGVGGREKKIVANAYYESMPPEARNLTGVNDIDGSHVHGIALLEDKTITGWSMTGYVYPQGSRTWISTTDTMYKQSRHPATGGALLRNVKKIGADFQASFALLEGDILTGWGNMGYTSLGSNSYYEKRLPALWFMDSGAHFTFWSGVRSGNLDSYNYDIITTPSAPKLNWKWIRTSYNYPYGEPFALACYETTDATHLLKLNKFPSNETFSDKPFYRGYPSFPAFSGHTLPKISGQYVGAVQSNFRLNMLIVSGGNNFITTSGCDYYFGKPFQVFEQVIVGGGPKAWVDGFMYIKPSRDAVNNPGLFNFTNGSYNSTTQTYSKVITSGFGQKTILLENDGDIWVSTDTGGLWNNWSTKGIIKKWRGLAYNAGGSEVPYSQDQNKFNFNYGKYITAFTDNGYLWVSNDTGETWQQKSTLQDWSCAAISSGGKYQAAGTQNGYLWRSEDYGQNWSPITDLGIKKWKYVYIGGPMDSKYRSWVGSFETGGRYIDNDFTEGAYFSAVASDDILASYNFGKTWRGKFDRATFADKLNSLPNPTETTELIGGLFDYTDASYDSAGNYSFFITKSGQAFETQNKFFNNSNSALTTYNVTYGYYSGLAGPTIPLASYPNIYLTGVKDFDIGQNYINVLLKTGSNDTYMMSGWGSMKARIRKDGLRDVKKVISTADHVFALLKTGNTTVISGWGKNESNLDNFEIWVLSYYGYLSGLYSGFLHDYEGWTGIKDFDVGYNHGIAIFEDDKVSGWCSSQPPQGKDLIAQINNKYKTVLDAKMNFYLDAPSFSGGEYIYFNDITPYQLKFNQNLNQWEAVSEINSLNPVAYRSKGYGSGALIGTWEGVGNSQGQQLEVVNNTVQSIYPIELGEAYISAVSDKDWIQIDNQNLIFPWNKTVAYIGSTGTPIQLYNLPTSINYNFITPNTLFTPYEGAAPTTFQSIYNANNINSANFSQYGIDSQGRYHSTNTYVPYKVRFIADDFGKNWITGISNDNKRYTSLSMDEEGKAIVAVNAEGDICASSNSGKDWSRKSFPGYSWKSVDYNKSGSISGNLYLTDYSGFVYSYAQTGLGDNWNSFLNPTIKSFTPRKINTNIPFSGVNFVKSFPNSLVKPDEYLVGTIPTYHNNGLNNNNAQIIGEKSGTLKIMLNGGTSFDEIYNVFGTEDQDKTPFLMPSNEWVDIACSQNYQSTIALRKNKAPLLSDNTMMNFYEVLPTGNWTSAAISKNGRYMLVTSSGLGVYQSIDFGGTWNKTNVTISAVALSRNYTSCSMSDDGKFQAFAADKLYIYMSKDYGSNWFLSNTTTTPIGLRSWSSVKINNSGDNMLACSTLTGEQTPGSLLISSGCVVASQLPKLFDGGVTLYPTTDYPLTVYRETSGASSFREMSRTINPEMGVNEMQTSELFLYQNNSKSGEWILSLRYLKDFLFGSSTFDKGEEIITSQAKSLDETVGYAFPPRGLWNNFYTRDSNNNRALLNSGLNLEYSIIDQTKSIDSRTGYMQDVNFYIDYSKMLPNYSNLNQVYRDDDNSLMFTKFGANITVKDASSSNWTFNQNGVIEANPNFAVNVARFVSDTGVSWDKTITNPICGGSFNSANIYDALGNNETPLRSVYIGPDYSTTRSDNTWYIFIKFFTTGFNNFSGAWGNFKWKTPYMFDKSSKTKIPFISEIYSPGNPSRGLPLWSGMQDNWELPIYSGVCYHLQVRLYHPLLNSGAYVNQERNIWSQLSTTGAYSGGYFWNGIEDQGSGELSAGLSLERGREYRFIQEKPINDTNKLKIYPSSGVEVYEYDSDNPSDYRFIQVKIKSEDTNNQYISWAKGDQSFITGFTGNFANCRGNYTIGKFYETDITGVIPDPTKPNYIKYSSNQASGEWYFNSTIENKILGTIKFLDKLYPAEFWYLSGSNYNTWPNDKANGFKTQNAYAFLKSGDTKIPFYGTLVQTAKSINTGVFNPSGNGSSQKHIWNGRFKIIGKNDYAMRANYLIDYPNPTDRNPFDINLCTDYNRAADSNTWEALARPLAERSGISYFSGVQSTGYFFMDRESNFYARDTILVRKNSITNIVFIPPTQARLTANKIAFWTGSSKTGPWGEITGSEASVFGGNSNFFNINSLTDTEPGVTEVFGEVWQLIQIYVPNTVNSSQFFAKFGPKNSSPNCALGTGCRHTNLVAIDDGLPPLSASGYYQLISGNNALKTTVNYSQPTSALFKGNVNVWSSDPYFTNQIPVQLTGAIDYISY